MPGIDTRHKIIEKLYSVYKSKGYVTENMVIDTFGENDLPLDEVDYVCDQLLSMGVIINDNIVENIDDVEDNYDRSQTDYEALFHEVVAIDGSLAPYIDEIRQVKPPQHRELQNLIIHAKSGNAFARERIIEMYLRTVVRISLWHHQKYRIPLAETLQDGCLGLVIALDKYDIGKQEKFSIYSPWWIRQVINREAPTLNPLVYTPVHMKDKLFNIYDIIEEFFYNQSDGKISPDMLKAVSERLGCSQDEAKEYINYLKTFESIEELIEKDESLFIDNCVADEQLIVDVNYKELKSAVSKVLPTLKPREQRVILLRFGFIDGKEWTLEEVGREFGVTRERIRQIEKKALSKLRHPSRCKKLKCFIE